MSTTASLPRTSPVGIDPRGPQFAAGITSVVLIAILLLPTTAAIIVTAVQAVLFGIGATRGAQRTPYSWLFRTAVRPRLGRPQELEDPAPPRFAQAVGFVFTAVALVAFLVSTGSTNGAAHATNETAHTVGLVAIGLALVAALLNAVFRFCLGCELYLIIKRFTH
jgi:hypothetical protein